ncbi:unnamed protein product, partial [Prunus brigantina]
SFHPKHSGFLPNRCRFVAAVMRMNGSIIGRCRFGCKTLSILIFEEHSSCLLETNMDVRMLYLSLCNENINAVDINVIHGGSKVYGNGEQDKMDLSNSE